MDIAFFQSAQRIFDALIELPPAERAAALIARAEGSQELIELVQELLEADAEPLPGLDNVLQQASAPPALASAGDTIGRYVVERLLGRGGMAEVWSVRHTVLGTHYALKLLTNATPAMQRRLLSEGRAQARLQHANIVPVWDVLDVNGVPGLLMLMVRGPSLNQLLGEGPLPRSEALWILRGIVEGVTHAHRSGLIHRDIKPDNVLIDLSTGAPVPRVTDFGLVKASNQPGETHHGVIMGTPAYAAPELLRDAAAATPAADLFSLGTMLVELLAGHRPYPCVNLYDVIEAHGQPPDLSGLDPDMADLAARLLDLDPSKRPTGEALLAALPAPMLSVAEKRALTERAHALSPFATEEISTTSIHTTTPRDNLPAPRDAFIGREPLLSAVVERLSGGERLLTLLGTGGVGKTRLALEAGRRLLPRFPGGVWFCDASEARDRDAFLATIARALQVRLGREAGDDLAKGLRGLGRGLLILDNLEQIRDPAAPLLSDWLDAAPELSFLCTSRAPLRLRGEQRVPIPALDVSEGAALFTERAAQHSPSQADSDEQAIIEELVEMLDGLPLAIELAAARSRLATPSRLRARLSQRFKLLSTRSPDRPERQKTLWKTLQWSWDLLTPPEQQALAQLSVFEDGFTVDAAESVVELDDEDAWIEDALDALAESSWLTVQTSPKGAVRLGMLRSIHEFASAKLDPDEASAAEERHGRYIAQLPLKGGNTRTRARLLSEAHNVTAAFQRAVARSDDQLVNALADSVGALTQLRGPLASGIAMMNAAIETKGLSENTRFTVLFQLSHLYRLTGMRAEAQESLAQSRAIAERTQNNRQLYTVRAFVAFDQMQHGQLDEALVNYTALLKHNLNERFWTAAIIAHNNISVIHMRQGHPQRAKVAIEAALTLARAHNLDRNRIGGLLNLAQIQLNLGEISAASANIEEGLSLSRQMGDRLREASLLQYKGIVLLHSGDSEAAVTHTERSVRLCEELGAARHTWVARSLHAQALMCAGQHEEALQLLEGCLRYCEENQIAHMVASIWTIRAALHLSRGDLGAAQDAAAAARVQAEPTGHALLEARARIVSAQVFRSRGDIASAAEVLRVQRSLSAYPYEAVVVEALQAGCLAESGDLDGARACLAAASGRLSRTERVSDRAFWLLEQARVAHFCGDEAAGQRARSALTVLLAESSSQDLGWFRDQLRAMPA